MVILPHRARYEGLDRLRGLLALAVVVYHYVLWLGITLPIPIRGPLDLLGLYAVSCFYCLSGAALFIVYRNRPLDRAFLSEFFIKRAFRIIPLFWFATTAAIARYQFEAVLNDPFRVFLSYSMLFSWLDPLAYFATGAWSIGNEWAFYTIFPILLWAWKKPLSRVVAICGAFAACLYFAFGRIDPTATVSSQWGAYVSPLNQIILFVGGMFVGSRVVNSQQFRSPIPWLIASGLLFVGISWMFDSQECIYGLLRVALVAISLAWCYGWGILRGASGWVGRALDYLGALSYSVYLLHPLVFGLTKRVVGRIASGVPDFLWKGNITDQFVFVGSVVGTIVASHYSFRLLERPMMNMGRSLAKRKILSKGAAISSPSNEG